MLLSDFEKDNPQLVYPLRTLGEIMMAPILASIVLVLEATIALGILLAIPLAVGYGAFSMFQRREDRG